MYCLSEHRQHELRMEGLFVRLWLGLRLGLDFPPCGDLVLTNREQIAF